MMFVLRAARLATAKTVPDEAFEGVEAGCAAQRTAWRESCRTGRGARAGAGARSVRPASPGRGRHAGRRPLPCTTRSSARCTHDRPACRRTPAPDGCPFDCAPGRPASSHMLRRTFQASPGGAPFPVPGSAPMYPWPRVDPAKNGPQPSTRIIRCASRNCRIGLPLFMTAACHDVPRASIRPRQMRMTPRQQGGTHVYPPHSKPLPPGGAGAHQGPVGASPTTRGHRPRVARPADCRGYVSGPSVIAKGARLVQWPCPLFPQTVPRKH